MPVDFDRTVLAAGMKAFGVPVTYRPAAGPPVTLSGVFNRQFIDVRLLDEGEAVAPQPALGCRASQLPGKPAENDQFLIEGQTWSVKRVHDDGLGHYTIFLHGPL